jgi:uncharacterized protein (UPF0264 family)
MTKLLVSVRNAEEAKLALHGGADIVDVKEPIRGALGAADADTISSVIEAAGGCAPISMALGELVDFDCQSTAALPVGASFAKWGMANCQQIQNWHDVLRHAHALLPKKARPVGVVYADWRAAGSPEPARMIEVSRDAGCPVVLFDTFDKSAGRLFDHIAERELASWIDRIHQLDMCVALAGSLQVEDIPRLSDLAVDIIAVRGAACVKGRTSLIDTNQVRRLKRAVDAMFAPPHETKTPHFVKIGKLA